MINDIGVLYFYTCSESVEHLDQFLPMFCSISFGSFITTLDKTTDLSLRHQIISLDFPDLEILTRDCHMSLCLNGHCYHSEKSNKGFLYNHS